jgi:hypothetical protein
LVTRAPAARRRRDRRDRHWALRALVLGAPIVATACFDLPKIDPGTRFVADFNDGGLGSTWSRFGPWSCDTFTNAVPNAGAGGRGGADAGQAADGGAGSPETCQVSPEPGDDDPHALRTDFTLGDPADGIRQLPGVDVVSRTAKGTTVDLTGFKDLVFGAILESAPAPLDLPSGTLFQVELGCSAIAYDNIATETITGVMFGAPWVTFRAGLDEFVQKQTSLSPACRSQIDSIHFAVRPGLADGASTAGTLHIDNITLQN